MTTATRTLELDQLKAASVTTPALRRYVSRLELMRQRIEEHAADKVLWAVAYGGFVDLVGTGKERSTARMRFQFVTSLQSVFESYEMLADEVLGPLYCDTGWFIDYDAWTPDEFRRIAERGTSERLNAVLTKGVTVFGTPPYPGAD